MWNGRAFKPHPVKPEDLRQIEDALYILEPEDHTHVSDLKYQPPADAKKNEWKTDCGIIVSNKKIVSLSFYDADAQQHKEKFNYRYFWKEAASTAIAAFLPAAQVEIFKLTISEAR